MDRTSNLRIAEGTAKKLAQDGHYEDAAEILKNAVLRKHPPRIFEYTYRWVRLGDDDET